VIGARDPKELVFTSGGTESINLALKGVAEMYREKGNHIVTTVIEQRAGIDVCKRLERQGFEVTYVPVQPDGVIDVEEIRKAITDKTILISVMFANNEIGTIQDIAAIGKLAKEKGIIFHTDATQALGKTPIDVEAMGIDLLSCTGAPDLWAPRVSARSTCGRKGPRVRLAPASTAAAMSAACAPARYRSRSAWASAARPRSAGEHGRGQRPDRADARSAPGHDPVERGRGVPQRPPRPAAGREPEHLVCLRRGRVGADGASIARPRCRPAPPAPPRPWSRRT
jgi:hypothetical protein